MQIIFTHDNIVEINIISFDLITCMDTIVFLVIVCSLCMQITNLQRNRRRPTTFNIELVL